MEIEEVNAAMEMIEEFYVGLSKERGTSSSALEETSKVTKTGGNH